MKSPKLDTVKIAEHAEANRWSAAAIAKQVNMSPAAVINVLQGKNTPSATNLKAICDTIGLSVEEVFITEAEAAA